MMFSTLPPHGSAFRFALLALSFVVFLAGCTADGPRERQKKRAEMTERLSQIPTVDISSRLYSQALDLKAQNKCQEATPLFYQLSMRGDGFELAQYHLADCIFKAISQSATSTEWLDGLVWMRRAAEAGAPEAQGTLALIYATGPDGIRDLTEAAMWVTLFEKNPARKKPGFSSPISSTQLARINQALTSDARRAGEQRAENWKKILWPPVQGARPNAVAPRSEGGIQMLTPGDRPPRQ
ncbi:sel1 repeat family protein [Iodidimonas gelatinilytica]|uniref:sel1 repeat family protein n=1 Tax=Iodidimonas gelatinilytica TaxID=1236966 RepID=UPI0012309FE5|nr:sel1 repeat family protein [Iodidimonas gelatinilytica]